MKAITACAALAVLAPALAAAGEAIPREGVTSDPMPVYSGAAEDYTRTCEGCHAAEGAGIPGLVPRLSGFVGLYMRVPGGREYIGKVPGVALALLDDARLAAVINWTLVTYSPKELPPDFRPYTGDEVAALRAEPLGEVVPRRAALIEAMRMRGLLQAGDDGLGPREMR